MMGRASCSVGGGPGVCGAPRRSPPAAVPSRCGAGGVRRLGARLFPSGSPQIGTSVPCKYLPMALAWEGALQPAAS